MSKRGFSRLSTRTKKPPGVCVSAWAAFVFAALFLEHLTDSACLDGGDF
jgi:hypothetical protein